MKKISTSFAGLTILIVDDYPLNHEILISLLKPTGCTLFRANSGLEAIDCFKNNAHIDIIFMDVMMPDMDGYRATQEIRKLEGDEKHTPVVALTANAEAADRDNCLNAGMDDYITKPIRSEAVEEMVIKYILKPSAQVTAAAVTHQPTVVPAPVTPLPPQVPRQLVISVVASSGTFIEAEVRKGEQWLTDHDLVVHQSAILRPAYNEYFNGTDAERLAELHEAFAAPGTSLVWLARGGSGLLRLLPQFFPKFTGRPPIFVGFSDGSALLSHLWSNQGSPGIHAPNVKNLPEQSEQSSHALISLIKGHGRDLVYPELEIIHLEEKNLPLEGTLIPANLTVLSRMVGTPSMPMSQATILVVEDVNEAPYRIDEMLTQLLVSGNLKHVKAIILGDFTACGDNILIRHIFLDFAKRVGFNLLAGMPCGHESENWALPFGVRCRINIQPSLGTLKLLEELVIGP